ncbi:MAG: glycosyltransferase, partial [Thermodesulfobacteriota bacterium]|nr:glycosyltransferase [Thermodesulfobacteriota bacterium]
FGPEARVILLFGAIRPYKGLDTALKAFEEVLKGIPEARLLIAGKLWQRWERYEELMEELGIGAYVRTYLTYVPSSEVYRFFVASDLVVLPYHHFDSQSGVGAAALSFGKPMIVTDVGGLPDLVEDRCYVVAPKDSGALAQAVMACLTDDSQLGVMAESTKAIAARVAWPAIARKTWTVYQKVLAMAQGEEEGQDRAT